MHIYILEKVLLDPIFVKSFKTRSLVSQNSFTSYFYRPFSRRLDRCDRMIQSEAKDPFGGNVYYVTMQIKFFTCKFRNLQRNLHCDVVHITTKWVFRLTLDGNGIFAIKTRPTFTIELT